MTADKLGWRSESRPDIAREYARIASRQRNQALDKFVAANEELFAANARKQRRIGLILGAVVSLIFVGLLMYTHYEQATMTDSQKQTLAEHPQDN